MTTGNEVQAEEYLDRNNVEMALTHATAIQERKEIGNRAASQP